LLVLHAGLPWEWLPQELGYGSGMTCRRRLRDWQAAGVWSRLHRSLLEELHAAGQIDWDRSAVDAGPGTQGTPVQGTVLSFTAPAAPVTPPPATGHRHDHRHAASAPADRRLDHRRSPGRHGQRPPRRDVIRPPEDP
jgi:transposase